MSDQFGLVTIPSTASAVGEAPGDPALSRLLAFLKAFLNTNALLAWRQVFPVAGQAPNPVNGTFTQNPEDTAFPDRQLPALFCWRDDDIGDERIGDDILLATTELHVLWVFPFAAPELQAKRQTIVNTLWKQIVAAIERGRTPGWVVSGDTDPLAASQGSLLYPHIGAWSIRVKNSKRQKLVERIEDGETTTYFAFETLIELEEQLTVDITTEAALAGGNVKEKNSGGTVVVDNNI